MDTSKGYIKLPRALLDEEISRKPCALALFVHLLTMANREPRVWNGLQVERGQVVTSRRSLSKRCGMSEAQVRAALSYLSDRALARLSARSSARSGGGALARLSARGYTLITICEFDSYEGEGDTVRPVLRPVQNEKSARSTTRAAATIKEDINILSIIDLPEFVEIVREWMDYKRERGQAYKGRKGLTQFYNRLRQYSGGDPVKARSLIDDAMAANYATVYPPRDPRGNRTSAASGRLEVPPFTPGNFVSTL